MIDRFLGPIDAPSAVLGFLAGVSATLAALWGLVRFLESAIGEWL